MGILVEFVAKPMPNVIAAGLPTNSATSSSSSKWMRWVPVLEKEGRMRSIVTYSSYSSYSSSSFLESSSTAKGQMPHKLCNQIILPPHQAQSEGCSMRDHNPGWIGARHPHRYPQSLRSRGNCMSPDWCTRCNPQWTWDEIRASRNRLSKSLEAIECSR